VACTEKGKPVISKHLQTIHRYIEYIRVDLRLLKCYDSPEFLPTELQYMYITYTNDCSAAVGIRKKKLNKVSRANFHSWSTEFRPQTASFPNLRVGPEGARKCAYAEQTRNHMGAETRKMLIRVQIEL
jgi:hypothetical protein